MMHLAAILRMDTDQVGNLASIPGPPPAESRGGHIEDLPIGRPVEIATIWLFKWECQIRFLLSISTAGQCQAYYYSWQGWD
jgi:hypothetical protein